VIIKYSLSSSLFLLICHFLLVLRDQNQFRRKFDVCSFEVKSLEGHEVVFEGVGHLEDGRIADDGHWDVLERVIRNDLAVVNLPVLDVIFP
jgi:hypothetical protein